MRHASSRLFGVLGAAAVVAAVFSATPANAQPASTKMMVYQAPCAAETCTSHDRVLTSGGVAAGTIQIQASSSTQVGFDFVRLEARTDNGTWTCFATWSPSSTSFWASLDWDTYTWRSCNSSSPLRGLTQNQTVSVRLYAHEKVGNGEAITSPFLVKLNNRPDTVGWAARPTASGTEDRNPTVELRWHANPEPDIVEYHFLRNDSDGAESEFAVSASAPGGQGCSLDGTDYVCVDDSFDPKSFGGTYTYAVLAYRVSPADPYTCTFGGKPECIESPMSAPQTITLAEPVEQTPVTTQTKPKAAPSPRHVTVHRRTSVMGETYYKDFGALPGYENAPYDGTLPYSNTLPYESGSTPNSAPVPQASSNILAADEGLASGDDGSRQPWPAIAGGLVMLLFGLHLTLLLRTRPA